jgi:hypothetical protein
MTDKPVNADYEIRFNHSGTGKVYIFIFRDPENLYIPKNLEIKFFTIT